MFYVYTLTDPGTDEVFYVGKGCGSRAEAHEAEARRGATGAKCDRIREIWMLGGKVQRQIVQRFKCQDEALKAEAALIASIGLENLTNVAPGGFGGRHKRKPFRWTAALVAKAAPSIRAALSRATEGRLFIGEFEITKHVEEVLGQIRRDLGDEGYDRALAQ